MCYGLPVGLVHGHECSHDDDESGQSNRGGWKYEIRSKS